MAKHDEPTKLNLADIQGNILTAYGRQGFPKGRFFVLNVRDGAKGRKLLLDLLPEERQSIVRMKAEGLSSKDIGESLGISERTVQRVLEDLRRRVEADWERPG